jgi:ribosomal protein S18 acetylase RimI-like enzyme
VLRIEPVSASERQRALALLAEGPGGTPARAALSAFSALLGGAEAGGSHFWWAVERGGPRAAALTVPKPGRHALIFHGPPAREGVSAEGLVRLLEKITAVTLADGATFVQALLPPGRTADRQAYGSAGYEHLAQLLYMRRFLAEVPSERDLGLAWATFHPGQEERLARVITDTYAESLDCPALLGRRAMADVIASHKTSGVYRPASWWMPALAGECVGCLLMNATGGRPESAEIVYLGVRPGYRRRGLGAAMLRHALADAARRRLGVVHLAVDAANAPAVALYRNEGFLETDRREVYARFPPPGKDEAI